MASAVGSSSPQNSLSVHDKLSGRRFLVDTGAQVSVFPASESDRASVRAPKPALCAANGSKIYTYGTTERKLELPGGFKLSHTFILADVARPLLGYDFFKKHCLVVDCVHDRLMRVPGIFAAVDVINGTIVKADRSLLGIRHVSAASEYEDILNEFPSVSIPKFGGFKNAHGVTHTVPTSGPPVFAKARRLSPERLACAKMAFDKLLADGIIRRSDSPWASPLHLVPKSDGSWRPCGDFRRLNLATADDRYPLPHLQDFAANLAGAKIFTVLDLVRGYHQIPMDEKDIKKTAIITPFGLFEYVRMPFGMKNSAQAFQRLMDSVFRGIPYVFVYLDDILVASKNKREHKQHLREVFSRLNSAGLAVNVQKCVFGQEKVKYLGQEVSAAGVSPLPSKLKEIINIDKPATKVQMQRYLGMVNFYHRFLPAIAKTLGPLHALVAAAKSPKSPLEWTSDAEEAFRRSKEKMRSPSLLAHPRFDEQLVLTTDASDAAVGAVLSQGTRMQPLGFFSRKLTSAQTLSLIHI